jgi:hypothetical protein
MVETLSDIIEPSIKFVISEKNSNVDGEHILAEISGEFFVPDGMSRNGRFYPRSLWEKVINNSAIQKKLKDRLMFGTVGHDAPLGDAAIRDGVVSHIMTELKIDENGKGIGKALILGTPAGKILNTVIRAGSKLAVSSRANGTFKGKHQGKPVVDEDNYELEGWDFVVDPGFLEAKPDLKESLQEIHKQFNIDNQEGDNTMSDENKTVETKLVEHIANENSDLKVKVSNMTDEINKLKESNQALEDENKHLGEQLEVKEELEKKIAKFEELGTLEQVTEALEIADKSLDTLSKFEELADTPSDAKSALEASESFITKVNEMFGSLKDAETILETMKKYEELGTPEQVSEVLKTIEEKIEAEAEADRKAKVESLSKVINKSIEETEKLLEKYEEDDIITLHGTLNEDKDKDDSKKFKKNENKDELESDVDKKDDISESVSLAEKIGSSLTGSRF